jgi:hypothetical protein
LIEELHEGGFGQALARVFQQRDIRHVWAGAICVSGVLLGFLVLSTLRRHFGGRELKRLFFTIPLMDLGAKEPETEEIQS